MAPSIGVNLRVTGHCSQGGRKHMEDMFSVAYQQTEDEKDLEYAFFGIFDGHGGREAAMFAKNHLMDNIVDQKGFWSDSDDEILKAIKEGFHQTHYGMWKDLENWPKTASGLPSTAGTTASIAFIRKGKIYIGHVGDSQIILGYHSDASSNRWVGTPLTREHKPESKEETMRIQKSGGKVVSKQGVPRVVWNRPRNGHKGPVRRSTLIDEIPFLAVARSLGDLWSYNSELDEFVVSPEPDVEVIKIKVGVHKCLIFGTDGLWNMMTPMLAASIVHNAELHNEQHVLEVSSDTLNHQQWTNPSKNLVDQALRIWSETHLRADNTSAVTLMLDPPGPPRAQVLRNKRHNPGLERYVSEGTGCVTVYTRYRNGSQPENQQPETAEPAAKVPCYPKDTVQINEVSSTVGKATEAVKLSPESPRTPRAETSSARVSPAHSGRRTLLLLNPTSFPPENSGVASSLKRRLTDSAAARCSKRRAGDEDDAENSSDVENKRVSWHGDTARPSKMEAQKKVGPKMLPVKRTLRSDTVTPSPVRTLRSRNVDILPEATKLKSRNPASVISPKRDGLPKMVSRRMVTSRRSQPQPSLILETRLRKRWSK